MLPVLGSVSPSELLLRSYLSDLVRIEDDADLSIRCKNGVYELNSMFKGKVWFLLRSILNVAMSLPSGYFSREARRKASSLFDLFIFVSSTYSVVASSSSPDTYPQSSP